MALQTFAPAVESGLGGLLYVERIEYDALLWIERRQLKHVAVLHGAYRYVVVEKQRARRPRGNLCTLKARFREHQQLRIDVDFEILQQRRQITQTAGSEIQLQLAALYLFGQARDRIVHRYVIVLDREIVDRNPSVLVHSGQRAGDSGNGEQAQGIRE